MTSIPNAYDPAAALWARVSPSDFGRIEPFLQLSPVPVGEMADALSLEVVSITLDAEISGLIRRLANGTYEIQVNNTDAPVRQRFTVAHEISHYLLHRDKIDTDGITDSILYRSRLSDRLETEANKLAAAILLPWDMVQTFALEKFGAAPNLSQLDEIASSFKVSSLAVGFRFGF